jgi:MerR family transcriptional regulator, light-induced transcriptional regulator
MLYSAPMETGLLRIGELSRRSGVSPDLLRAWERRYQLLRPTRSVGGLRLYSAEDLERVRAMQQHLAEGLAAAEAAALATSTRTHAKEVALAPEDVRRLLDEALTAFDDARAQGIFDSLLSTATLDTTISAVVVPYLHELGERWERGEVSVGQEHFASNVLRGRLLGLARGWGRGVGPRLVLACAPGEQHDLGLISFGLALRARGWRVVYLGADTPLASVADAANASDAVFVVVSAVDAERFEPYAAELRELAQSHRLCLAGVGAEEVDIGAEVVKLSGDPVEEAERLTTLASQRGE